MHRQILSSAAYKAVEITTKTMPINSTETMIRTNKLGIIQIGSSTQIQSQSMLPVNFNTMKSTAKTNNN